MPIGPLWLQPDPQGHNGHGRRIIILANPFRGSSIWQSARLLTAMLRVRVPPPELLLPPQSCLKDDAAPD